MRCTCSLVAAPYPTRACLTSLAVYWATSHPAAAAAIRARPLAWPTDMAVFALTWKKTRSTTTDLGPHLLEQGVQLAVQDQQPVGEGQRGVGLEHTGGVRPQPAVALARGRPGRSRSVRARGRCPIRTCVRRIVGGAPQGADLGPAAGSVPPEPGRRPQPSKAASTSSAMSALECTAWTSSWSSMASRRRRTFLASASSGTGTGVVGSSERSTDSG